MRLKTVVCFGDVQIPIPIPCGDGDKTVKWLALVAAQRFVIDSAARGSRRNLHNGANVACSTQLIPSGVETDLEAFYHPDAKLRDVFVDSQEVRVKLEPKMRVGAAGQPRRSRWSTVAFTPSDERARAAALDDEYRERDARLRALEDAARELREADESNHADQMRALLESQLFSKDQIRAAMAVEWAAMNEFGVVDKWVRAKAEQEKLRGILEKHFVKLAEMFKFYGASTASAADSNRMEFVEFVAFVRDIELLRADSAGLDHSLLAAAFAESCGREVTKDTTTKGHLELAQFLNSLIWLAQFSKQSVRANVKHVGQDAMVRQTLQRRLFQGSGGLGVGGSNASGFSISLAVQRLIDENVAAAIRTHRGQLIGPITRELLGTDAVLSLFHVHHAQLLDVFKTYLPEPPAERHFDAHAGYMAMGEYQLLMADSMLVGAAEKDKSDELTLKECRQAFAGSQVEQEAAGFPLSPQKAQQSKTALQVLAVDKLAAHADLSQDQLLSYAEFLEALLRVALLKWASDLIGPVRKLELAIQHVLGGRHAARAADRGSLQTAPRRGKTAPRATRTAPAAPAALELPPASSKGRATAVAARQLSSTSTASTAASHASAAPTPKTAPQARHAKPARSGNAATTALANKNRP
ncbi:hypothetical protein M885DRAFT_616109 [Pelagophyceae sp. CCMP2097]|nr:hypothetical protein M885DRAFT_616109 [Pelagophyceae sp. CCMP2097]